MLSKMWMQWRSENRLTGYGVFQQAVRPRRRQPRLRGIGETDGIEHRSLGNVVSLSPLSENYAIIVLSWSQGKTPHAIIIGPVWRRSTHPWPGKVGAHEERMYWQPS
jgi:hypothetical protein